MTWTPPEQSNPHGQRPAAPTTSHASVIRRDGRYEVTLDGLRLGMAPLIADALNRLANESAARGTTIIASIRDLNTRYHMQFNPDGTSARVAPPVPPEASLGRITSSIPDLGLMPDGGVDQEEWVAQAILGDGSPGPHRSPEPPLSREAASPTATGDPFARRATRAPGATASQHPSQQPGQPRGQQRGQQQREPEVVVEETPRRRGFFRR